MFIRYSSLGTSAMQSGVLANRLIGMILAVSMLTPSWIGGTCCCFRKLAQRSGACCAAKELAKAAPAKKSCCANRAASKSAPSLSDQQTPECHPVSPCRCRPKVDSAPVIALRQFELKSSAQNVIPAIAIVDQLTPSQPSMHWQMVVRPGAPPDAPARCALLCRWLA